MSLKNGTESKKAVPAHERHTGRILASSTDINISEDDVPIPKQGTTEDHRYKELVRRYHIVPWYNLANEFPLVLALLAETSVTHRACINSKATWAVGDGFLVNKGKRSIIADFARMLKNILPVPDRDQQVISEFLERANPEHNWLEFTEDNFFSFEEFGNNFVELSRGQRGGERFFNAFLHDTTHCLITRPLKDGEPAKDGIKYVRISADWQDEEYLRNNPPAKVPMYPAWERDEMGVERTIIHWKNKAPGRSNYGVPTSVASLIEQQLEHEIPLFNKDGFENGFFPSAIATFFAPNGMTKSKANEFITNIHNTFTGKGKKKKLFAQVVESESMKHDVTTLNDQMDGDFLGLDQRVEKKIVRAHHWYEILIGNPTAGKLGESQEIRNTAELARNMVIRPLQNKFIAKVMNPAFKEWCLWMNKGKLFENYYFNFSSSAPISFMGDLNINELLTRDEGRDELGFAPMEDEKGKEIIGGTRRRRDGNDNE